MTQELIVFTEPMLRANPANWTYFMAGAGNLTSTSQCSIGVGKEALSALTSGGHNVAVGFRSLKVATTPGSNVCVGSFTGENAVDVIDSVAIGFGAFRTATTGVGGTAVGMLALEKAVDVGGNTGVGDSALRYTTTGVHNVAMGYTAMDRNETGSANIAIGTVANFTRLDGDNNCFVGQGAGRYGVTGSNNIGVGFEALAYVEADNNVGMGHFVMHDLTTGTENTAVGYGAGQRITTGSGNSFLGSGAGQPVGQKVDATGSMALGQNAITTKDNQVVVGSDAVTETLLKGNVSIGRDDPTGKLHVEFTDYAEIATVDRVASSAADGAWQALKLRAARTGTMGDGMGVAMELEVQDGSTTAPMGTISAVRRSSNTEAEILIRPRSGSGNAQGLAVRGNMAVMQRYAAPVAGGDAGVGFALTSSLVGIFCGSGAPTISAAKGSLYMRTDGSTTNDRMYVNTDGSTGWTAVITAA